MVLPESLEKVLADLIRGGTRPVIVGGAVRDHLLGLAVKDHDVEVYGISDMFAMAEILSRYGSVHEVGKQFGVLKLRLDGLGDVDFALPRTEEKIGAGHRGFAVTTDGELDFFTAAKRRDFTINAVGYDVAAEKYLDPYGGQVDLEQGILHHIDDATFVEDPLRVYRAVQFAARFGLTIAEETFRLCRRMVEQGMLDELPRERVWMEWQKLLLRSPRPSVGFELMKKLGITERYFPELHALIGVPQNPEYHPEGDVWNHTMMTVDAMTNICRSGCTTGTSSGRPHPDNEKQKIKFMLAILCHDLGKSTHTTIEYDDKVEIYTPSIHYPLSTTHSNVRIRAIGHEAAGVEPTRSLLARLTDEHDLIESIVPLVEYHLAPAQYYRNTARDKTIRRLSVRLAPYATIRELNVVAYADFLGRDRDDARSGIDPSTQWLEERAALLGVLDGPPEPLLQGRDLIELGLEPSVRFGEILDAVYEEQIRGNVKTRDEALRFVHKKIGR